MTRLLVNVELDERGRPVFQLTPAQLAELGLVNHTAPEARWEVATWEMSGEQRPPAPQSPFRKYLGVAPPLEGGSVQHHRQQLGYEE